MKAKSQTMNERFWSKVNIKSNKECWDWRAYIKPTGYGQFTVHHGKYVNASRIAYILTHGEISDSLEVCHSCDNPKCVNPRHLFLGSHKDNMQDMVNKGRGKLPPTLYGKYNSSSKLSKSKVKKIFEMKDKGKSLRYIGNKFGVTKQAIWSIIHKKNWI